MVDKSFTKMEWKKPHPSNPQIILYTDASITGWGAAHNDCMIHGKWSQEEQQLHINHLELKAIFFTLQAFRDISHQIVLIRTAAYINHQGRITSKNLSMIAEDLWKIY